MSSIGRDGIGVDDSVRSDIVISRVVNKVRFNCGGGGYTYMRGVSTKVYN